jgi:hypothetical protein
MIGELKLIERRDRARARLGAGFDIRRFSPGSTRARCRCPSGRSTPGSGAAALAAVVGRAHTLRPGACRDQ